MIPSLRFLLLLRAYCVRIGLTEHGRWGGMLFLEVDMVIEDRAENIGFLACEGFEVLENALIEVTCTRREDSFDWLTVKDRLHY